MSLVLSVLTVHVNCFGPGLRLTLLNNQLTVYVSFVRSEVCLVRVYSLSYWITHCQCELGMVWGCYHTSQIVWPGVTSYLSGSPIAHVSLVRSGVIITHVSLLGPGLLPTILDNQSRMRSLWGLRFLAWVCLSRGFSLPYWITHCAREVGKVSDFYHTCEFVRSRVTPYLTG